MTNELYEYLFSINVSGMVAKVTIPEHSNVAEIQLYGFNDDDNSETSIRYMITALTQDKTETYQLLNRYDAFLKWFNKELNIEEKLRDLFMGSNISNELIHQMETVVNNSIWCYNNMHAGESSVEHELFATLLGEQSTSNDLEVKSSVYIKLPRLVPEGEKNPNLGKAVQGVTKTAASAVRTGNNLPVIFSNLIDYHAIFNDISIGTVIDIDERDAIIELCSESIPTKKVQYLLQHANEFYLSVVYHYNDETNTVQSVIGYMIEWMKPNVNYPNTPEMNLLLNNIAEVGFCAKVSVGKTSSAYHVSIQPNTTKFNINTHDIEEFKTRYQQFEDVVFRKSGLDGTVIILDETLETSIKIKMIQDIYTDAFHRYAYTKSEGIVNDFLIIMGADRMENEE